MPASRKPTVPGLTGWARRATAAGIAAGIVGGLMTAHAPPCI
ncbi:hypothetical protein ACFC6U_26150 [Kitasatospora purpeofusca]